MNPPDKEVELEVQSESKLSDLPWLQQAVDELRQPVTPSVAGQLRAARRTALASGTAAKQGWVKKPGLPGWGMAFAAGLGAVAVALMVFSEPQKIADKPALQAQTNDSGVLLEDLSIMAAQDDLQFYQDLELLQWLDQEGWLDAQS